MTTNTPDGAAVAQSVDARTVLQQALTELKGMQSADEPQENWNGEQDYFSGYQEAVCRSITTLESALASSTTPSPAVSCPDCDGEGVFSMMPGGDKDHVCPLCQGSGKVRHAEAPHLATTPPTAPSGKTERAAAWAIAAAKLLTDAGYSPDMLGMDALRKCIHDAKEGRAALASIPPANGSDVEARK